MDSVLALLVGVGLAASCGFRVFVPMLVMGIAARVEMLSFSDGWDWIGTWPALIAFSVASVVEIGCFYIPWLDNLLDTAATPVAVVAGIVATAACVSEMDPFLQWTLAIIAGGGAAGLVQGTTVLVRGASTITTAGLGNFVVSTGELVLSILLAVLAVVAPIVAFIACCGILCVGVRLYRRVRAARSAPIHRGA